MARIPSNQSQYRPRIPSGEIRDIGRGLPSIGELASAGVSSLISKTLDVAKETHRLKMGSLLSEQVIEGTAKYSELLRDFSENAHGPYIDAQYSAIKSAIDLDLHDRTRNVPGASDQWYADLKTSLMGPAAKALAEAGTIRFGRHLKRRQASFYEELELVQQNGDWDQAQEMLTSAVNDGIFNPLDVLTIKGGIDSNYFKSNLALAIEENGGDLNGEQLQKVSGWNNLSETERADFQLSASVSEAGRLGQEALQIIETQTILFRNYPGDPETMTSEYFQAIEPAMSNLSPQVQENVKAKAIHQLGAYLFEDVIEGVFLGETPTDATIETAKTRVKQIASQHNMDASPILIALEKAVAAKETMEKVPLAEKAKKEFNSLFMELSLLNAGMVPIGFALDGNHSEIMFAKIEAFVKDNGGQAVVGHYAAQLFDKWHRGQAVSNKKRAMSSSLQDALTVGGVLPPEHQEALDAVPFADWKGIFQESGGIGAPHDVVTWTKEKGLAPQPIIDSHLHNIYGIPKSDDLSDADYALFNDSFLKLLGAGELSPGVQKQIGEKRYLNMLTLKDRTLSSKERWDFLRSETPATAVFAAARETRDQRYQPSGVGNAVGYSQADLDANSAYKKNLGPGWFEPEKWSRFLNIATIGFAGTEARAVPSPKFQSSWLSYWGTNYDTIVAQLINRDHQTIAEFEEMVEKGVYDGHFEAAARAAAEAANAKFGVDKTFGESMFLAGSLGSTYGVEKAQGFAGYALAQNLLGQIGSWGTDEEGKPSWTNSGDDIASPLLRDPKYGPIIEALKHIQDTSNHGFLRLATSEEMEDDEIEKFPASAYDAGVKGQGAGDLEYVFEKTPGRVELRKMLETAAGKTALKHSDYSTLIFGTPSGVSTQDEKDLGSSVFPADPNLPHDDLSPFYHEPGEPWDPKNFLDQHGNTRTIPVRKLITNLGNQLARDITLIPKEGSGEIYRFDPRTEDSLRSFGINPDDFSILDEFKEKNWSRTTAGVRHMIIPSQEEQNKYIDSILTLHDLTVNDSKAFRMFVKFDDDFTVRRIIGEGSDMVSFQGEVDYELPLAFVANPQMAEHYYTDINNYRKEVGKNASLTRGILQESGLFSQSLD